MIINDNLLSDFNCSAVTDWTKMLLVCNFCVIINLTRISCIAYAVKWEYDRSLRTTQSVSVVLRPQGQSDLDAEILASASKKVASASVLTSSFWPWSGHCLALLL